MPGVICCATAKSQVSLLLVSPQLPDPGSLPAKREFFLPTVVKVLVGIFDVILQSLYLTIKTTLRRLLL